MTQISFPMVIDPTNPPNIGTFVAMMNALHERIVALETVPASGETVPSFSAADRSVLDEVAGFLGVHRVVANTLESKANQVDDIDPVTGLKREVVQVSKFVTGAAITGQPGA
jgi:hypothetical protein